MMQRWRKRFIILRIRRKRCKYVYIHCQHYSVSVCRFEKLISGKYLGAITHAALLKLTRDKVLFGGKCSEKFGQLELDRFESKFLSDIEGEK